MARDKGYRAPSRAELQAFRDQKQQQNVPSGEAGRREQELLKHYSAAQEDLQWIVDNNAWMDLGFETFTGWYSTNVVPVVRAAGLRPTQEFALYVLTAVRADEAILPPAQRLLQRELAGLVGVSESTLRRLSQDRSEPSNGAGADLEPAPKSPLVQAMTKAIADASQPKNSGNVSTPSGVPGQDSPDALIATSTGLQPANDLEATHPGPDSPADRPLPSDTADGPTGSVATDQLGIDSSLAGDGASTSDDAERPPAPAAGDEAAEVSTPPPSPKSFTEGQAATPPREPVLPSAPAGVSEAGGVEDGPESLGDGLSSTDLPVVVYASVEGMAQTSDTIEVPRAEWAAMSPAERRALVEDFGTTTMNNAGGYGSGIESGAPDSDLDSAPAESWMNGWRGLIGTLASVALDIGDDERDEVWDDLNLLRALLFPGRES